MTATDSCVVDRVYRPVRAVQDWRKYAECGRADPDIFFPTRGNSARAAIEICLACRVRVECLEWALDHEESFGIWGGTSEIERRVLVAHRRLDALTRWICRYDWKVPPCLD